MQDDDHRINQYIFSVMYTLSFTLLGNLCRCTGYRSILNGYRTFCKGCSCATKCGDQSDNKEVSLSI